MKYPVNNYQAPSVEFINLQVEKGFADSNDDSLENPEDDPTLYPW